MGFSLAGIKPRTRLPFVGGLLGVLYLPGLLGCGGVPPEVSAAKTDTVLFRGCRVVQETDAGTVCLPSAISQTIVWIADRPCDTVELAEDGTSVTTSSKWVEGGCQIRPSERSTKQTSTYSIRERKSGKELWSLNYDRSKPWLLGLTDRMWLRADSDLTGVAGTEPTVIVGIDEHPAVTIDRAYAAAVVLIRQGKIDESLRALAEVQELAMRLGYPSIALDAAFRRVDELRDAGFPFEAYAVLQGAARFAVPGYAMSKYLMAWHAGLLFQAQSDLVKAEQKIRESITDEKRVSDIQNAQIQMPILADILFDLNRSIDAQRVISDIPLDNLDSCSTSQFLQMLFELQLSQWEVDAAPVDAERIASIESLLVKAAAAKALCTDVSQGARLSVNIAHLRLLTGQLAAATAALGRARAHGGMTKITELEALDLEARIAIKDGRATDALASYEKLDEILKTFAMDKRIFMNCRVLVGKLEAKQIMNSVTQLAVSEVLKCADQTAVLGAQDRKALLRRLRLVHPR